MATTPRNGKPWIWATWLTGILSGDKQCQWAPWFRAHFRYVKIEDANFNLAAWSADHVDMVNKRAEELRQLGWTVRLETENEFKWHGQAAILSGKPDIVARLIGECSVIEDCKTGAKRNSDYHQVLLYMLAGSRCLTGLIGHSVCGTVVYRDQRIQIQPEELTGDRANAIYALLRTVGGNQPPKRTPSVGECGRCDIGPSDCQDRVGAEAGIAVATTLDF